MSVRFLISDFASKQTKKGHCFVDYFCNHRDVRRNIFWFPKLTDRERIKKISFVPTHDVLIISRRNIDYSNFESNFFYIFFCLIRFIPCIDKKL